MNNVFLPTDLPGITFKSIKRPRFSTQTPPANSGDPRRTVLQPRVSWFWSINYEFIRLQPTVTIGGGGSYPAAQGVNEMFSFFASQSGASDGFLYRDPTDYLMTVAQGTFFPSVSDGTSTSLYQIARIVSPTFPFLEIVTNGPWTAVFGSDTFEIYDNGSPYGDYTDVSINSAGQVKFNVLTAPLAGHSLTWAGAFYFPVRFVADATNGAKGSKFMFDWTGKGSYWSHTIELESNLQ